MNYETNDCFTINIGIDNEDKHSNSLIKNIFNHIIKLVSFEASKIPTKYLKYYMRIFHALGNKKSFYQLSQENKAYLTIDNVFTRIAAKKAITEASKGAKYISDILCDEIEYISSHFSDFDKSQNFESWR